ncbi:MAG: DNA internalization-related competence protein ComEC/Rec2 [Ignavibacteria bacterium]|nr:DNA internalization-related competence protein ComEC/Rec2 [Ignavibacteria bacterium]
MVAQDPATLPALRMSLLFAAGILLESVCRFGVTLHGTVLTALLLLLFLFLAVPPLIRFRKIQRGLTVLIVCGAGALGFAVDSSRIQHLPDRIDRHNVVLSGDVISAPMQIGKSLRYLVESRVLADSGGVHPFRATVLVSLRTSGESPIPRYGMTALFRGSIDRPRMARNPGDFDRRRYYEANGITHTLSVVSRGGVVIADSAGGAWVMREIVLPARAFVLREIEMSIGGQEGEYLKGVMIGERGGLTPEIREAFSLAGVAHILAVSGSNVAVVATFVFLLAELFRFPRRGHPAVACLAVVFYMLLVGYQPPVVRATIMAVVLLIGTYAGERSNPINSLGVSGLIILGLDARQLFDVGFQLSFLAVFSIVYLYPFLDAVLLRIPGKGVLRRGTLWTLRLCSVSLVATLGTLPLTAGYFGRVSVIGLLANIAVIPASGLSLLLGFIAIPLSVIWETIADVYHVLNLVVLRLTLYLTVMAGRLPFAAVETFRFTAVDAFPFYAGLALLFHFHMANARRILVIILMITLNVWIFFPQGESYRPARDLRISFIDVGQGDAILLELPGGKTVLVDAGPCTRSMDAGKSIVVPFLGRRGIATVDLLVTSHPHSDHIGGAPAVLDALNVGAVINCGRPADSQVYHEYQERIELEQCRYDLGRMGGRIDDFEGVRIYLLAPEEEAVHLPDVNNGSVVLKVVYGRVSFLLTGDAEREAERHMVARYGPFLRSTLLKVGHHGSRTSTSPELLAAVDPVVAVISVGRPNFYHHPAPEVIRRMRMRNVEVLRTDDEGAIIFETNGEILNRVYWREPG